MALHVVDPATADEDIEDRADRLGRRVSQSRSPRQREWALNLRRHDDRHRLDESLSALFAIALGGQASQEGLAAGFSAAGTPWRDMEAITTFDSITDGQPIIDWLYGILTNAADCYFVAGREYIAELWSGAGSLPAEDSLRRDREWLNNASEADRAMFLLFASGMLMALAQWLELSGQ
jgi:hypothetical protein